ncbi:MAG: zinc ABC transporter substrate-binding protein, partial [Lentisphaeria bacterium]|nr:zinc ABC transporter substrate-binding protein [Lentisphaeria bacterium]
MRLFNINIVLLPMLLAVFFSGCTKAPEKKSDGKLQLSCGLPPVAFIVSAVAGNLGEVAALLPEGRSPHDYSPRPADIRNAGRSRFFFTTGMNFENSAARALPANVGIVDVSENIRRRRFDDGQDC